ncbi:alpha/beta hydrolase fold [Lucifera butyrica]|uniref:Alpha/beta hydrolase fold n=1 Tax=Lucifera butyrica TaxID=1351585 RepID=A0A498RHF3_9FIRM|nr:subtype B tannase [Lucifera butyrica]VBB09543.1 alpha/beta hydrolase fold [Lucifera butyrica]
MKIQKWFTSILVLTFLTMPLASVSASSGTTDEYSLVFDTAKYTMKTLTLNGKSITYRAYENIVYVKYPVDTNYEIMNIYVPEEYYEDKSIGNYNAKTAPIFLPNTVGGYMPGAPGSPGQDQNGSPNAALVALSKGYVVAEPGARGRTTQDKNSLYTGKAPACIVDLKAAVRYLRYNQKRIPGDTEKIISNGTSAGGALSALLGASGNNKDYEPYLKAIGAADARDDIFAVSSYCPITNLDNADMAYEWLFNGINGYSRMMAPGPLPPDRLSPPVNQGMPAAPPKLPEVKGTMTADQIKVSDELKALFPAYLNDLGLKKSDGTALTLDANGDGPFKDYVKSFVVASAQKALDHGTDLSGLTWITIKDRIVTDIDFDKYLNYATRMKSAPAFDALDLSNPENSLFGTATVNAQHFTQFSKDHSTVGGSLAAASIVKLLNPMNYIGTKGTTTAQHWRIRHGAVDKDTALAIPVILATKLENKGFDVDFAVPWGQGHGGDYDLNELFVWIDKVCAPHQETKPVQ